MKEDNSTNIKTIEEITPVGRDVKTLGNLRKDDDAHARRHQKNSNKQPSKIRTLKDLF